MTNKLALPLSIAVLALLAVLYLLSIKTPLAEGSIIQSQEYSATSTGASAFFGSQTASTLVRSGPGALGSVIIEGAAAGVVNIYDATTTDKNRRTNNTATSSILLVSLPASLAAGTYTFDIGYNTGLLIDLYAGTMPTSTITYR